jgi:phosphatidate cytidylyltransferase
MSYPDPAGHPDPAEHDAPYRPRRARRDGGAPEAYPAPGGYRYPDPEPARPRRERGGAGPDAVHAADPVEPWVAPGGSAGRRGTPAPDADWRSGMRTGGSPRPWSGPPAPAGHPSERRSGERGRDRGEEWSGEIRGGRPGGRGGAGQPWTPGPGGAPEPVSGGPGRGRSGPAGTGPEGLPDDGATRQVPTVAPTARRSRAGRNLPAAIGVGVLLALVVLGPLFLWRPAFLPVMVLAAGVGTWEMARAVGGTGARPPLAPMLAGCVVMPALAWQGGLQGLVLGLVLTVVAVLIWQLPEGPEGYQRDVTAATMIAVYVAFLLSFAVLLVRPGDGEWRVLLTLAAVVLSDTGGYAVGVFLGRHKMAPAISPGKSWEGFAGSLGSTAVGCAVLVALLFDVPWWHGAVLGLAVSAAAVLGDLAESMIKRDLGVKDMSNLLPGHGGLMDRLDSILLAAPVTYALLGLLAPPT